MWLGLASIWGSVALAGPVSDRIQADHRMIWAGIDYRSVEMFVPETFADPQELIHWDPGGGLFDFTGHFAKPKDAWMALCKDWNTMIQHDVLKRMEKDLKSPVIVDVPATCATAKRDPWFYPDYEAERHPVTMDATHVGKMVKDYRFKSTTGVAFVVIAERFSRTESRACVWPTLLDVASREVMSTRQICEAPAGIGFRNYWYNPVVSVVKSVVRELRDLAL